MDCTACKAQFVEYVEDLLSKTDRQAVEAHLQECRSCRSEAEHLARTHARLLGDGQAGPLASLAGAVFDRILRSGTFKPRETMWRTIMTHKYATIGVAAAACAAAVTVAFIVAHRAPSDTANGLSRQSADPPAVTAVSPATGRGAAQKPGPMGDSPAMQRLSIRSVKESVAEAEVILAATVLDSAPAQPKGPGDVAEVAFRFRVTRILKGHLADGVITIQKPGPAVGGAGVGELAEKEEWILMLSPEYLAGKHRYAGLYNIKVEPEVQAALASQNVAP